MPFTLPGEGQSVIIGGIIGAPTADASGNLQADYDGWSFSTVGPTLVEIEGLPVSHIRFAFMLAAKANPGAIERVGFDAGADQASRQVWLDRAGDWVLIVSDANNINDLLHPGLGGTDAPVGSDDSTFNYAFRFSTLSTPQYSDLAPATPMAGTYADGPKFFNVTGASGQVMEFWSFGASSDVVAATALYDSGATLARSSYDPVTLYRSGVNPIRVVADYLWNWTVDASATYEARLLTPVDLGTVSTPVTRTGEALAAARDSLYYTVKVDGNALVLATATPTAGASITPLLTLYGSGLDPVSMGATDFSLDWVTGTGVTEYVLGVHDTGYLGGAAYTYDLAVSTMAATEVAEGPEPNDTLATGTTLATLPAVATGTLTDSDVDTYVITLAAPATLVVQTAPGATSATDTILTLKQSDGTEIANNDDIVDFQNTFSRIVSTSLAAGTYLVEVSAYAAGDYRLLAFTQ